RIVEGAGLKWTDRAPFAPGLDLGEALLTPTRLYVRSCLAAHRQGLVKALAHITGGGFVGNVPRVLPETLAARIDVAAWPLPPVFRWLMAQGGVEPGELARTFNCGVGMIAVVAPEQVEAATQCLAAAGETVWPIGRLEARAPGAADCVLDNLAEAWA